MLQIMPKVKYDAGITNTGDNPISNSIENMLTDALDITSYIVFFVVIKHNRQKSTNKYADNTAPKCIDICSYPKNYP